MHERTAADWPQLEKAFAEARTRCQAVMVDAAALVERCRSAKIRRAADRDRTSPVVRKPHGRGTPSG
jgi:hypothetical protein